MTSDMNNPLVLRSFLFKMACKNSMGLI